MAERARPPSLYVAEGGANIVVRNRDGFVLRLRKAINGKARADCDYSSRVILFQAFMKDCFFRGKYIGNARCVRVDGKFLDDLSKSICDARPPERSILGSIDTSVLSALELPDYTMQGDFSIEIKPKWPGVSRKSPAKACSVCCEGESHSYCPVDLFSGDPERVRCAIRALIASPRNQLRVFSRGLPLSPSSLNTEAFLDCIVRVLIGSDILPLWSNALSLLCSGPNVIPASIAAALHAENEQDASALAFASLADASLFIIFRETSTTDGEGGADFRIVDLDIKPIDRLSVYRSFVAEYEIVKDFTFYCIKS